METNRIERFWRGHRFLLIEGIDSTRGTNKMFVSVYGFADGANPNNQVLPNEEERLELVRSSLADIVLRSRSRGYCACEPCRGEFTVYRHPVYRITLWRDDDILLEISDVESLFDNGYAKCNISRSQHS